MLKSALLGTPLGALLAVTDEKVLYLLEFVEHRGLKRAIERLCKQLQMVITPGDTAPLQQIRVELKDYFAAKSLIFSTPLHLIGSPLQQSVWQEICKIPPGEARSYLEIAQALNKPTAVRAIANANGANQIAIVVPCHRVINTNGNLGGYRAGLGRKQWLLAHEKNCCQEKN